jgi:hypothetical protein
MSQCPVPNQPFRAGVGTLLGRWQLMSNRRHRRGRSYDRAENLRTALLVSKLSGCVCDPDLLHRHTDGVPNVTVHHDAWCPMADHASQLVIRPRSAGR